MSDKPSIESPLHNSKNGYLFKVFRFYPEDDTYGSSLGYQNNLGGLGLKIGQDVEAKETNEEETSYKNPIMIYGDDATSPTALKHFGFSANSIADPVYSAVPLAFLPSPDSKFPRAILPKWNIEKNLKYLPGKVQRRYNFDKKFYYPSYKESGMYNDEDEAYNEREFFGDMINDFGRRTLSKMKEEGKLPEGVRFNRLYAEAAPGFKFSETPHYDLIETLRDYIERPSDERRIVLIKAPMDKILTLKDSRDKYSQQRDTPNERIVTAYKMLYDIPPETFDELATITKMTAQFKDDNEKEEFSKYLLSDLVDQAEHTLSDEEYKYVLDDLSNWVCNKDKHNNILAGLMEGEL